ncbi:hypothetical protein MKW94_028138 [Papaver nudicaule]|uniref:Uncharacterized protein n=1 Tax=Papaver nudicaule TaxID=74823 RepID=A0AA42AR80_PAPNU|nr:hypothetical protein [Papaver nudicaule]
MALRNFTKMLSRIFSSGPRSSNAVAKVHISDEKLRSFAVRLEQATEEANQLADECKAYFALRRAFTFDKLVYIFFCFKLSVHIAEEAVKIRHIKVKDSKLAAYLAKESQSPA